MNLNIFITSADKDYELLDSGDGMKLERFGKMTVSRPDPQALWNKNLDEATWAKADARFIKAADSDEKGKWVMTPGIPEKWPMRHGGVTMEIKLTPFKHTGIFPEQLTNWTWASDLIKKEIKNRPISILNLFGYTGGASLSAAAAGAEVTHVDASKAAITWANENAEASGLKDAPIRWILEDAAEFVKREVRRGRHYDAVIMDPPSFGRGAKGEIWKIEEDFLPLVDNCFKLLSDKPLFFIINGYAAGYSAIAYENNLKALKERFGGTLESGELALEESNGSHRLLPCGIVSRWKSA